MVKAAWHGHDTVLTWLFENTDVIDQLYIINHAGENVVELALQAGHASTAELLRKQMEAHPRQFRKMEGDVSDVIHAHKALKMQMSDM